MLLYHFFVNIFLFKISTFKTTIRETKISFGSSEEEVHASLVFLLLLLSDMLLNFFFKSLFFYL